MKAHEVSITEEVMRVAELAKLAGVGPETIRYYARMGLLPERKHENGYRFFTNADMRRLRFVRSARLLGFRLKEVMEIIRMSEAGRSPCPRVRSILSARIDETSGELLRVAATYATMKHALTKWSRMRDGNPDGHEVCRLIEAIERDLE